jgi:hypothetical protein
MDSYHESMWTLSLRRAMAGVLPFATAVLLIGCGGFGGGPQVQAALPNQVPAGPGAFVLIQGSNFARNATARVGSSTLGNVTWVNDHLLTAELPPGMAPGAYDLTVSNGGSGSGTLRQAIRVQGQAASQPAASAPTQSTRTAQPAPSASSAATQPATSTRPTATRAAATQPPPTPAPALTRPPATQAPPPTQAPQATAITIAGTWSIVDIVLYGPGMGGAYPFTISIHQNGNQISGSGDGLALRGVIDGDTVTASYSQSNGSTGTFTWTVDPSGSTLQGRFDNSIGNGGSSVGQRTAETVVFAAPAPPQSAPAHGKGKGH